MDHVIGIRFLSAMRPYHRHLAKKFQQNPSDGSSDSAHTNLFGNRPFFAQKWANFGDILPDDPGIEAHILPKFEHCSSQFERMRAIQIL